MAGTKRCLPQSAGDRMRQAQPQPKSLSIQDARVSNNNNKGLRHFSMLVCKKVEEKGTTTYNEVADELVQEFATSAGQEDDDDDDESNDDDWSKTKKKKKKKKKKTHDDKNIRRRVYDALNVLMAMDILVKEKKEIRWKGLPFHSKRSMELLHQDYARKQISVQEKRNLLKQVLCQSVALRNLVRRNLQQQEQHQEHSSDKQKVALPFVLVHTQQDTVTKCEMTPDASDVMLDFDSPIHVQDDIQVLSSLSFDKTSLDDLKAMLPSDLFDYCQEHQLFDTVLATMIPSSSTLTNDDKNNHHLDSPRNDTLPLSFKKTNHDDPPYLPTYDPSTTSTAASPSTSCQDHPLPSPSSSAAHELPPIYPTSTEQV